jgi:hypothetical protein
MFGSKPQLAKLLKLRHPYRAIIGNLTYTLSDVWAWYRIPTVNWDILREGERDALERSLLAAFDSYRDVDCHLLTAYRPFDVDGWAESQMQNGWWRSGDSEAWRNYVAMQAEHMLRQEFLVKEVYLGIRLGSRQRHELASRYYRFKVRSGVADPEVPDYEQEPWILKDAIYGSQLARGGLRGRPASFEELVWLSQRNLHHRLAHPVSYGTTKVSGVDLGELFQVAYHHGPGDRSLVYEHPDGNAHVAFLAFTNFPEDMTGREWLNLDSFDDVEVSWRYRLLTPHQARKRIESQLRAAHDNSAGAWEAGTDVPLAEKGHTEQALLLERDLMTRENSVLVGRPFLRVSDSTHQGLAIKLQDLTTFYRESFGIRVVNRVSPLPFALEALPGDKQRVVYHQTNRTQSTSVLVGSMPLAAVRVGDETGPYLGYNGRTPIFWDPLRLAQQSNGTVVGVVGRSGQGKTNLTLECGGESVLRGATGIYATIKGETENFSKFPGMSCNRCRDCRQGRECRKGLLNRVVVGPSSTYRWDPIRLGGDPDDRWPLASELVALFIPNPMTNQQKAAVDRACQNQAELPNGSMHGVREELQDKSQPGDIQDIGQLLHSVSRTPLGKLFFGHKDDHLLVPEGKMTIIEATGLDLPDPSAVEMTQTNRVSVGIVTMITWWAIRQAITNRHLPKYISFDEVAFLLSTAVGLKVVNLIGQVHGRANNTTLVLSTQNASALMNQAFTINMVARFGFQTPLEGPEPATMEMFDMDDTTGIRQFWGALDVGECVFSYRRRRGSIKIDLGPPEIEDALDTQAHPELHLANGFLPGVRA